MKNILNFMLLRSNLGKNIVHNHLDNISWHSFCGSQNFVLKNNYRLNHLQCKMENNSKLKGCRSISWNAFNNKVHFGKYAIVSKPSNVSERLTVPCHINRPCYADTGKPLQPPATPEIKSVEQIDGMRKACQIARIALDEVSKHLKVGLTNEEIDIIVHNKAIEYGCYPSPLNYHGFPKSCCTSVNNIACHGIPDDRALQNGDIISVDVTVFHEGFHGDCCDTFLVGDVDEAGQRLVMAAKKCRDNAIHICGPGVPFAAIGSEVEKTARAESVTVVPAFIGHGIGTHFHEPPDIFHCYNNYRGVMEAGMTFTVEPVVAQGNSQALLLEDGWTVVMVDNGRAAQFEHTILITDTGHNILTK